MSSVSVVRGILRGMAAARTTPWTWSSILSIGLVPGTPEESRAFLQERVALFLKVLLIMFGSLYLVIVAWSYGFLADPLRELRHPVRVLHLGVVLLNLGAWLYIRAGRRSMRVLNVTDIATTLALCLTHAVGLRAVAVERNPLIGFVLVLTYTLAARAALIPSSPSRTLALGTLGSMALVVANFLAYRAAPVIPPLLGNVWSATFAGMAWCGLTVLLTTVTSRVIYGLRRQIVQMSQLGQYTLEEKIGEGGMGVVYRASHAMLRRPTAIKLLPLDKAGERTLSRFEREVRMTAKLTHPNTIAIYDYGRTPDGVFYYAMELLDGLDLEQLVRLEGAQPASRVVHVLRQAASALAEAHTAGLIHRDIKPANIILCERGGVADFVKVVDFGLVKETNPDADVTQSNVHMLIGTPTYMSPESIVAPRTVDGRSDLYALGAVGYFLLTGEMVFEGTTLLETYAQHLHQPVVPPSERTTRTVPKSLEAVVLSCLEKDPDKRPKDALTLVKALEALDDVPRWTEDEAREWWDGRGATMRETRKKHLESPIGSRTVGVDLEQRAIAVSSTIAS